jgi:hypothetical protein
MVQMMPRVKPGNLSLEEAKQALAIANKDLALELAQGAADVAGIFDPTPISDGISAAISLAKGDYVGAGLSLISMVPYVGDALGKPIKAARNGKKILQLRKEIAVLIARINDLSPAALKAAQKTKGSVSEQMKKALNTAKKGTKAAKKIPDPIKAGNRIMPNPQWQGGLPGFPNAKKAKPKTPVQGGGGMRSRWKDPDGKIYEWDYQHGKVEQYNKKGKHLGEFDAVTGQRTKPADPTRSVIP